MWIIAALESELDLLKKRLGAVFQGSLGGYPHYKGKVGNKEVRLGVTGIGISSACLALGAFISLEMPNTAVMVGTAGAMPDSGLKVCDMVTAEAEILSELGEVKAPGIGDIKQLKIDALFQRIDFNVPLTQRIYDAASITGPVCLGKVLTVVGVSAQPGQAKKRGEYFNVVAENMEGYGLALTGQRFGIKTAEIRGISNIAGDNDKSCWDFKGAKEKAQMALLEYLKKTF
ncbi:futalosine hydrolase [Thermodesulfobacteriota bacterium]